MVRKKKILKPGVYEVRRVAPYMFARGPVEKVRKPKKQKSPETILQYGWQMKKHAPKKRPKAAPKKKRSEFKKVMSGEKLPPWIPAFERWSQQTGEEVEAKLKKRIGAIVYELKHRARAEIETTVGQIKRKLKKRR